jgi:hypothetical protein
VSDPSCFWVMGRSRRVLGGPQIAAQRVRLAPGGRSWLIRTVAGAREPPPFVASVAAACQRALGSAVGVVDPRAKRRFWD